ncbi:MAG TPA: heavy metal-associated domain-containing protein [Burkholderiaceae bacterium]|nr:heavy metal-associated domain-containing protein [Burkholderiaceae bacterium]
MELIIEDMTCARCAQHITGAIEALDSAAQITIDLGAHRVAVHTSAPPSAVLSAIEQTGYRPQLRDAGAA